ncbi:MAG TPA: AIR synthase related protein [Stellaceae bacterium]|nr:AIR synthase related protein [Stellaceae bacterium]
MTESSTGQMDYAASGVDYEWLDLFKRECQKAARGTADTFRQPALKDAGERGESAHLIETATGYIAHVEEGLGTKNLVADAVYEQTGKNFYREIGIDIVATIVNDLATCGARPVAVAMHAAVASSDWFKDQGKREALAKGFAEGCRLSGAIWGGGETAALSGIVKEGAAVLGGSSWGLIEPKGRRIANNPKPGDAIVLLESSGIHANGITLCRRMAERLPQGYLTDIGDGRGFGEAMLAATVIYVPFINACQDAGIELKYAVNMTGHGWRKLMRLPDSLVYRIDEPGPRGRFFDFILETGLMSINEAYGTYNMGAGFAVYVSPDSVAATIAAAKACGIQAWAGGRILDDAGRKGVEISPLGIQFDGSSLNLR